MVDPHLLLLAFGAGVLGFFAPCSVAMLPAYIGYFLGQRDLGIVASDAPARHSPQSFSGLGLLLAAAGLAVALWGIGDIRAVLVGTSRTSPLQLGAMIMAAGILFAGFYVAAPRRGAVGGLGFGLVTTLGILIVYLLLGVLAIVLLDLITFEQMAWAVIAVGVLLVVAGVAGFLGRDVAFAIPIKAPRQRNVVGFLAFGAAYGVVSLGCNLPLLGFPLAAAASGPAGGIMGFLAYGIGAGILMVVVSVSVAAGRGLTAQRIQRAMPYLRVATNSVFIAAGAYITWYAWANFLRAGT